MARMHKSNVRGFSLLEVLIAVVVLSVGLLALATLQMSLIRSSTAGKSQSIAVGLAQEKLEQLKAFERLRLEPLLTCATETKPSYECIGDRKVAVAEVLNDNAGSLGGVNYRRAWEVTRYVSQGGVMAATPTGDTYDRASNSVLQLAPVNGLPSEGDFKVAEVQVSWNDADGNVQTISLRDAIASIDPGDSARSLAGDASKPRKPQVKISNPGNEAGVIPIAVGNGTSTAATNPKPVVNNNTLVETRFDVVTYSSISGDTNVLAQQRVETAMIGCKCSQTPGTGYAYRPSYWNGLRYVPPAIADNPATEDDPSTPLVNEAIDMSLGRVATMGLADPPQSEYCTACCRDHHDPSWAEGPPFDPRRVTVAAQAHDHYKFDSSGAYTGTKAGAGENYLESCRVIRVDGVVRAAADIYDDHFSQLATAGSATSPLVSSSATSGYQSFVIDYLKARIIDKAPTAGTEAVAFNTAVPNDNDGNPLTTPATNAVTTLEDKYNLNIETATPGIVMNPPKDSPLERWLHSRGLYVDYLESEVIAAIKKINSDCLANKNGCTSSTIRQTRILRILPFTSINLTEIALWNDRSKQKIIEVANNAIPSGDGTLPRRGKTLPGQLAADKTSDFGDAVIGKSNSALALWRFQDPGIDPDDFGSRFDDGQLFTIDTSGAPPSGGGRFGINLTGFLFYNVPPNATYTLTSARDCRFVTSTAVAGTSTNYDCVISSPATMPNNFTIEASDYNRTADLSVDNQCTNANNDKFAMPVRITWDALSASAASGGTDSTPSVFNPDMTGAKTAAEPGEYTQFDLTGVVNGDVISVAMGNRHQWCPQNYDSYYKDANADGQPDACTGTKQNLFPYWASTFVLCDAFIP